MKAVVVTGVSTGMGHAITKLFTTSGIKVFGSVRKKEDASRLSQECGQNYVPLIFDVTEEDRVKQAASFVRNELKGEALWGLINNAGIVVPGTLLNLPVQDLKKQLDVNLAGPLIVTQAFAPLLGADENFSGKPGKIINISSVAGKIAFPFVGAYAISKHGLEAFSDSLRRELMIFGIDVIIIGPGAVTTALWEKGRQTEVPGYSAKSVYKEAIDKFKAVFLIEEKNALPAEDIARLALKILEAKNPKARYAPVARKLINWIIPGLLSKRMIDRIIAKKLGLVKKRSFVVIGSKLSQ